MKGIILAGGTGSRLYPLTLSLSKQILPVYDKPMIYYPLSILLLSDIKEVLIITNPGNVPTFEKLLGDGSQLGIKIQYKEQLEPRGLADAFIVGEDFIDGDSVCLILGDNIFFGDRFSEYLEWGRSLDKGARIFGYHVNNPKEFGILEIDEKNTVLSIEEKPENPKSSYAIPGLYFFDSRVVEFAKNVKPSARGKIEITEVQAEYLKRGELEAELLGRGFAWFDTGTHDSLMEASDFIRSIQNRLGLQICCPEEISFSKGFINKEQLIKLAKPFSKNEYGQYLLRLAEKG